MDQSLKSADNTTLLNTVCGVQEWKQNGDRYEVRVIFSKLGDVKKKLLEVLSQGKSTDINTRSEPVKTMTTKDGDNFENLTVISVGVNSVHRTKLETAAMKELRKTIDGSSPII